MMNGNMPRLVRASGKIYSFLLLFYPSSLRRRFGLEMELLFQEQVRDAWEESGYTGFLRSWRGAAAELVRIALPARLLQFALAFLLFLVSPALYCMPKPNRAQPFPAVPSGDVVTFPSGKLMLHGVLFKPEGDGPFPAVLYNHGSAPGMLSKEAFDALGPVFTSRGWVFFGPYRRGQGLSASAGPYIEDQIDAAEKNGGGIPAGAATMIRLLETDHLNDQLAGLAWLRKQPFVQQSRIAVAGTSFGGIEAALGVEREPYCAAIDAAGGAQSWKLAQPQLQEMMTRAVRNARAPVFFFQAENDYDLSPSRTLSAAMKDAGKEFEMKIYPPYGKSKADGHAFGYFGSSVWADDVFYFLQEHCTN
jgi:carboxymethylenebutenolidase